MSAMGKMAVVGVWTMLLWVPQAGAQSTESAARPWAANVVVPQSRAFAVDRAGAVQIVGINVGVVIVEQVATTTMDVSLRNRTGRRTDAELIVPVPDGAVVRSFTFAGAAAEPSAVVLPADEARRTYDGIVARIRDPALLEFVGYNLIRSSVFPIGPSGEQKVRLTYEHLLSRDAARVDYVLPRSESLEYGIPWDISVKIKSKTPVSTVYSPSHSLETVRSSPTVLSARVTPVARTRPGAFRLSYLLAANGLSASLLAYPDPEAGGGYFLVLAGLPAEPPADRPAIRREVTLVIDRSGSMRGEKFKQVREAALQILAGLENGETFNIIAYNDAVGRFAPRAVAKNNGTKQAARAFLRGLSAGGGTNIHDALLDALRDKPADGMLPIVLFLTDGLPTVGETSEVAIRNVAKEHNPFERRIFTFGVGVDVNAPLLRNIADETRGAATFVLPGEDVEVKVARVFDRLAGPILADASLQVMDEAGQPTTTRVCDLLPAKLPDLFAGDQIVLLGRYFGEAPLHFVIHGNYLGSDRAFRLNFGLDRASTGNSFVSRLWAARRIGVLVDAIRQMGAEVDPQAGPTGNPRLGELTSEIVRLSTEFGILTEYTAFLAREGTDLSRKDVVLAEARENFNRRAIAKRSGLGAVNQARNIQAQVGQQQLDYANEFYDENMNRVAITAVQQISDRAFFRRGERWVDSRVVGQENVVDPSREVEFGSAEFYELVHRLAGEGRQGCVALRGDILLRVGQDLVLVKSTGPN